MATQRSSQSAISVKGMSVSSPPPSSTTMASPALTSPPALAMLAAAFSAGIATSLSNAREASLSSPYLRGAKRRKS